MLLKKVSSYIFILALLLIPVICQALEMDDLKADFLQGNYNRVIFEAEGQLKKINIGNTDELNYILGLSFLKMSKFSLAQECFNRILVNQKSKFSEQASLGLADVYLMQGNFAAAQDTYQKIINQDSNSNLKAAVLYRLSQLEFKRGNHQQGNSYYSKLKNDFPLSPELRANKGLGYIREISDLTDKTVDQSGVLYCVQVGFFSNSINADNLKNKLLSKNFPAYVENLSTGYRVRVGRFNTQKESQELETRLSQEGFPTKLCP